MVTFAAIAYVRSSPPRTLEDLREVLCTAALTEPCVLPDSPQVTSLSDSDRHALGLQVRAASRSDAETVLDRVRVRMASCGVVGRDGTWRLRETHVGDQQ